MKPTVSPPPSEAPVGAGTRGPGIGSLRGPISIVAAALAITSSEPPGRIVVAHRNRSGGLGPSDSVAGEGSGPERGDGCGTPSFAVSLRGLLRVFSLITDLTGQGALPRRSFEHRDQIGRAS